MSRKKPSQIKRMGDRTLSRLILDTADEIAALQAELSIAKREQRQRRTKRTNARRAKAVCGQQASTKGLVYRENPDTLH